MQTHAVFWGNLATCVSGWLCNLLFFHGNIKHCTGLAELVELEHVRVYVCQDPLGDGACFDVGGEGTLILHTPAVETGG